MKDLKKKILALIVLPMMVSMIECRNPVLHRVGGGEYAWKPGVNFTNWASRERFYVGDWLYFGFDKHRFNVLQVNKTSYENCIEKNFIKNITKGGRDVFNLTAAKPYYFLSGRGYCLKGMKVSVYVQDSPAPPSVFTNGRVFAKGSTSKLSTKANIRIVKLAATLVSFFLLRSI